MSFITYTDDRSTAHVQDPQKDQAHNFRLQGVALALGELAGPHLEPDLAAMVLESLDITLDELRAAGADAYDLARLKGSGR
jgi:hypothetical protein